MKNSNYCIFKKIQEKLKKYDTIKINFCAKKGILYLHK